MDKSQTRIYLLRHGETVNTSDGRFRYNGHTDVDVTNRGIAQLEQQAEALKKYPICRVYSSDLIRSLKGAQAIAKVVSAETHNDERLKEIHSGRWEALTVDEVQDQFPGEFEERYSDIVNFRIPGGENLIDARMRSSAAINELVKMHKGQEIAIVAHGGINRLILCEAMGLDLKHLLRIEQGFGCLNIIDYYGETSVVKLINKCP